MRQAAGGYKPAHRDAALAQGVHNPAQAARAGFERGAEKMFGAVMQGQPGESPAQRAVHQRRPAAVEPVHAPHPFRAGLQRGGFLSEPSELELVEDAPEPVESIANSGLAGFVAVKARQDAVSYD